LDKIGWKYQVKNSTVIIEAEPRGARVPLREFELGKAIPLRMALDQVGAETFWDPDGDKLQVCSPVTKISVKENRVQVETSLPVKPRVFRLTNPNRFVVDLPGTRLNRDTIQQIGSNVRVGQVELNTVRIAYEPGYRPSLPELTSVGTNFKWELDADDDPATADEPPKPPVEPQPEVVKQPFVPQNLGPKVQAGPLSIQVDSSSRVMMSMKLSGILAKPPQFRRPEPNVLEILLWNTQITMPDSSTFASSSVTDISSRDENGMAVLTLRLARPMGVELSPGLNNLGIVLFKPTVGDGKLAGKIVVVDAGHGGHDNGAKSPAGEVVEKTLTLKIAKQLSEKLANEGATVIMTRKTDVFIELKERAEIANRNNADFFISCHINSNRLNNSTSGGITFYHLQDPICQLLADCIQREIGKASGLKSIGTWSDGRIYQSGFSVLRNSKMPAVLVECGFINHNFDRKRMMTDDFQSAIAGAIVKGLKVYLGNGN